jgi:hypothetical protein
VAVEVDHVDLAADGIDGDVDRRVADRRVRTTWLLGTSTTESVSEL